MANEDLIKIARNNNLHPFFGIDSKFSRIDSLKSNLFRARDPHLLWFNPNIRL